MSASAGSARSRSPRSRSTRASAPRVLIAVGGVLYTTGAVIYARERPDPNPAVFGYHEIFHVLVLAAAAAHFAAIALYALPAG